MSHPSNEQVHDESGPEDQGGVAGGDAKPDTKSLARLITLIICDDPDVHSKSIAELDMALQL
jgi:hypothetical protein